MKKILRGILTVWIVLLLMVLGLTLSLKRMMVDTADVMIKQEITNNIIDMVKDTNNEEISQEVISKVEERIQTDENIQNMMDTYFDQIIDMLSDENSNEKIDVSGDFEKLIDDGEAILKDYGITLTEKEKDELLASVSTEEINQLVNDTITETKANMPSDAKVILNTYQTLTSTTFLVVIIVLIILSLVFIALLKKSYYKWLTNFGGASITVGILLGFMFPFLIATLINLIDENGIVIEIGSLRLYGYILIVLGILSYIFNFGISKAVEKNKEAHLETIE